VIAIEPSPTVFRCLSENIAQSGHTNISCVECAVGAEDGFAKLVDQSAYGYLSKQGETKVELRTLATLTDFCGLKRLDFVKIDVEGKEFEILSQSSPLINFFGSLVMFELNSWCMLGLHNANPREFIEWTVDNFDHVFMVRPQGKKLLLRVDRSNALPVLHDHLVHDRCISDFLVTNNSDRFTESGLY
jgi:FkbM family methyltransferase